MANVTQYQLLLVCLKAIKIRFCLPFAIFMSYFFFTRLQVFQEMSQLSRSVMQERVESRFGVRLHCRTSMPDMMSALQNTPPQQTRNEPPVPPPPHLPSRGGTLLRVGRPNPDKAPLSQPCRQFQISKNPGLGSKSVESQPPLNHR